MPPARAHAHDTAAMAHASSSPPGSGPRPTGCLTYLQLREESFDLSRNTKKEHRLRIGKSKVPFGFETLQTPQNLLPLDRNDAPNSAIPNGRDMGVFYYWAPTKARQRFKILVDSGFKGTGDYGVFGLGAMNGQTANRPEANNSLHTVMRLSYPWRLANGQFVEAGISGYNGRFVLPAKSANVRSLPEYQDDRVALSFTWYAQPFGVVAEYNWGKGPEFVSGTRSIDDRPGVYDVVFEYEQAEVGNEAADLALASAFGDALIDIIGQVNAVRLLIGEHQLSQVRATVADSKEAVVVARAAGDAFYANAAFHRLAEREPDECRTLEALLALFAQPALVRQMMGQVRAEQRAWRGEMALLRPRGEPLLSLIHI